MHTGFRRLYWIILVVDWGSRTGQVENLVHFHVKRKCDVVTQQIEPRVAQEMGNIALRSRVEIVRAQDVSALLDQSIAQMGTEESCPPGNEYSKRVSVFHGLRFQCDRNGGLCVDTDRH